MPAAVFCNGNRSHSINRRNVSLDSSQWILLPSYASFPIPFVHMRNKWHFPVRRSCVPEAALWIWNTIHIHYNDSWLIKWHTCRPYHSLHFHRRRNRIETSDSRGTLWDRPEHNLYFNRNDQMNHPLQNNEKIYLDLRLMNDEMIFVRNRHYL